MKTLHLVQSQGRDKGDACGGPDQGEAVDYKGPQGPQGPVFCKRNPQALQQCNEHFVVIRGIQVIVLESYHYFICLQQLTLLQLLTTTIKFK